MSVTVPLAALEDELAQRGRVAYLLTVSDDGRPHCVAVDVECRGDELVVRTGNTSARNASARPGVTLLAPPVAHVPEQPGGGDAEVRGGWGYSLIVDGDVVAGSDTEPTAAPVVTIRPTHAVLHRPASEPDGAPRHDCVPLYDGTPG